MGAHCHDVRGSRLQVSNIDEKGGKCGKSGFFGECRRGKGGKGEKKALLDVVKVVNFPGFPGFLEWPPSRPAFAKSTTADKGMVDGTAGRRPSSPSDGGEGAIQELDASLAGPRFS